MGPQLPDRRELQVLIRRRLFRDIKARCASSGLFRARCACRLAIGRCEPSPRSSVGATSVAKEPPAQSSVATEVAPTKGAIACTAPIHGRRAGSRPFMRGVLDVENALDWTPQCSTTRCGRQSSTQLTLPALVGATSVAKEPSAQSPVATEVAPTKGAIACTAPIHGRRAGSRPFMRGVLDAENALDWTPRYPMTRCGRQSSNRLRPPCPRRSDFSRDRAFNAIPRSRLKSLLRKAPSPAPLLIHVRRAGSRPFVRGVLDAENALDWTPRYPTKMPTDRAATGSPSLPS